MKAKTNLFIPAVIISCAVFAVFAGLLAFVRLPSPVPLQPRASLNKASVRISKIDLHHPNAVAEDADLLDTLPLFAPTTHNASELEVPTSLRHEPGTQYVPFQGRFLYTDNSLDLHFPQLDAQQITPVDALAIGRASNIFSELGQTDRPISPLRERFAIVEVLEARSGRVVYSQSISGKAPESFPGGDWNPLEAIANVNGTGLVGTPFLTGAGSGSPEVDAFFLGFLAKRFHLGTYMTPGVYIIRIGP